MIFLKLRRKVFTLSRKLKGDDTKVPVRKGFPRVKIMSMLKATEVVNGPSKKRSLNDSISAEQGIHISSLIRIQFEEIKRKVEYRSPAALRFIGPGDHNANLIQRGVIIDI
jgi:hypothetical protein